MKKNTQGFSIIEILIWIFIFSLWLVSVYALILTTMKLNDYSKNSIIASNLARESLEIVRNVRDSNYKNMFKWNKLPWNDVNKLFEVWTYYKVENNFDNSNSDSVLFDKINSFWEWKDELNWKMNQYNLCLNSSNTYTYDCNSENKKTYFYRYVKFDEVKYNNSWTDVIMDNAIKVTSKVIWYNRWYHEVQLDTILTDFLRQ